ncbi:MAG: glucose-6-phosphate dehydrogenase [Candidatus Diapherotrites archaeon]
MIDNFLIVIMGSTGDLAIKKLFPAIFGLMKLNKIGDNFAVVAVARKNLSNEEFFELAKNSIKTNNKNLLDSLKSRIYYFSMNFNDVAKYKELGELILEKEKKHNTLGNKLFYLATLPEHFSPIVKNLKANALTEEKNNWCRVVFEKPFGDDEKSARALNKEISEAFHEKQIFRIDHYLGKELVQSLAVLRGTNMVFNTIWDSKHIDHIQINLLEDFGIAKRGNYYDKYGALKDVFQNHILQLLALISMEMPSNLSSENIRNEKVKVLNNLIVKNKSDFVLGQYNGYCSEEGVSNNSKTETFFAGKVFLNNDRWKGTPFYVRSGKNLGLRFSSIYIEFKNPINGIIANTILPNYLLIQIQPESGILLRLNSKSPHSKNSITPVKMTFCHECAYGPNTLEAYENLLKDALEGDQSAFIRYDEIETSWKIVDKIKAMNLPIYNYEKGTFGPKESEDLIKNDNREWFNKIESVLQNINFY